MTDTRKAIDLKPCPVCDGQAALKKVVHTNGEHFMGGEIVRNNNNSCECQRCGLRTKEFDTEHEAVGAWNTRMAASSHCPICGKDQPHSHKTTEIEAFKAAPKAIDDSQRQALEWLNRSYPLPEYKNVVPLKTIRAALQVPPEGYVLVTIEPTKEFLGRLFSVQFSPKQYLDITYLPHNNRWLIDFSGDNLQDIYKAMISAAPKGDK